jgi:hypothetical protein
MNRPRRNAIGAMSVTVVIGLALGAHLLRSPPKEASPGSPETEVGEDGRDSLADRLTAVERKLEQARSRAAATLSPAPAPTEQAKAGEAAAEEGASPEAEPRSREQWAKEVIGSYEAFHAGQSKDPAWSASTSRAIVETLHEVNMEGSTADAVDCRTTVCRLDIGHADQAAQAYFLQHIPVQPPFDTSGFYHRVETEDGASRTVLYLARNGFELPPPPPN